MNLKIIESLTGQTNLVSHLLEVALERQIKCQCKFEKGVKYFKHHPFIKARMLICFDKGLTLEMSAFKICYGDLYPLQVDVYQLQWNLDLTSLYITKSSV